MKCNIWYLTRVKNKSFPAGCIATKMGLPAKLVCAVTCNDIVSRAVSRGDFSKSSHVTATLAPAMDIQVSGLFVHPKHKKSTKRPF